MDVAAYVEDNMVLLPAGSELVRDFVDPQKWISSNYLMSMPGTHGAKMTRETEVQIAPFSMLRTPVTNALYREVMAAPGETAAPVVPAVHVNWLDAVQFCNRLSEQVGLEPAYVIGEADDVEVRPESRSFRLPSDAEWQFACKGTAVGYRYGELDEIGWYDANSGGILPEVARKLPNQFGLYDMIGGVWEWCFDLYDPARYGNYRIFRGGSYLSEPRACGATSRRKSFPDFSAEDLGFRIVRSEAGKEV